jgi:hypothetical protein
MKANRKIEIKLKEGCPHCTPRLKELQTIFDDLENGHLPRDVKLTLELNSEWLGELVWHLDKVEVTERKMEEAIVK